MNQRCLFHNCSMMGLRVLCVTVLAACACASAQPAECVTDDAMSCLPEHYCSATYVCLPCQRCDKNYNRAQKNNVIVSCVKSASDCGACLKGMIENRTLNTDRCVPPWQEDEHLPYWWWYVLVTAIIFVVIIIGIIVSLRNRTRIYKALNICQEPDGDKPVHLPEWYYPSAPEEDSRPPPPYYKHNNNNNMAPPMGDGSAEAEAYSRPSWQRDTAQRASVANPPSYVRLPPSPPPPHPASPPMNGLDPHVLPDDDVVASHTMEEVDNVSVAGGGGGEVARAAPLCTSRADDSDDETVHNPLISSTADRRRHERTDNNGDTSGSNVMNLNINFNVASFQNVSKK